MNDTGAEMGNVTAQCVGPLRMFAGIAAIIAMLWIALLPSAASAQANVHNGSVPLDTAQNPNNTASGTLEDRGSDSSTGTTPYNGAQFDFDYALNGAASGAVWQGGIQYQIQSGSALLYAQANNTPQNLGRFPIYTLRFTRGVEGLRFRMGGIDNFDSNRLRFFYQGTLVAVSTAWVSNINANSPNTITPALLSATELEVASRTGGGTSNDLTLNRADIIVPAGILIDRVEIRGGKNAGVTGTNTLSFYDFDWLPIPINAANDSVTGINGSVGEADILNVLSNDALNDPNTAGADVPTPSTVSITQDATSNPNVTLDETTGQISVAAGTPPGIYTVDYTICQINTVPANCSSAIATIEVTPHVDLSVAKSNGVNEVISGTSTTYTLTVSNSGPDAAVGPIVTDTPGAGLTCDAADPVTITGDGVPAGSFTIADLTGPGITLGTLSISQTTNLSYSCQVN